MVLQFLDWRRFLVCPFPFVCWQVSTLNMFCRPKSLPKKEEDTDSKLYFNHLGRKQYLFLKYIEKQQQKMFGSLKTFFFCTKFGRFLLSMPVCFLMIIYPMCGRIMFIDLISDADNQNIKRKNNILATKHQVNIGQMLLEQKISK